MLFVEKPHAPEQLVSLLAPWRSVSLLVHISPVEDVRIFFFPSVTIKKREGNEAGGVISKVQVFLMIILYLFKCRNFSSD